MIRIASFLVFFIGAAVAFGAFYVARGSETDAPRTATAPVEPVAAEAPETPAEPETPDLPEAQKLYYLADIDFDQGEITVVYPAAGQGQTAVILRDQAALRAAKDTAFLPQIQTGADDSTPLVQIFRADTQIATVPCPTCPDLSTDPDHAALLEQALPHQIVHDNFSDHDTYLATIDAISTDPNFMLLDLRPAADFPTAPIDPALTISLPTAVVQSVGTFDSAAFDAQIRTAIDAQLPDGATITAVTTEGFRPAFLADKDNGQFVSAGGQPIAFPDARFLPISVTISGTDHLSDAAYDAITQATLMEFNVDDQFETFVTSRLQTTCVDCYFLKVDGPFYRSTRPTAQTPERYALTYYDLREAP